MKPMTDTNLRDAAFKIEESGKEIAMIYATCSYIHIYIEQIRTETIPENFKHDEEMVGGKLYDWPLTIIPDSCEDIPQFWIAKKERSVNKND